MADSRALALAGVALLWSTSCSSGQRVPTHAAASRPPVPAPRPAAAPAAPPEPDQQPTIEPPPAPANQPCDKDSASTPECRCETGETEACLELADDSFRRRDHDAAIIRAYALCERQVPAACLRAAHYMDKLKIARRLGNSAAELRARAIVLYAKACAADQARACFALGGILVRGKLVTADPAAGERHLHTACNAAYAPACAFLAAAHESGEHLKKDDKRALLFRDQACQAGGASSCTIVADSLARKDKARARTLYEKGCQGDDGMGCARSARLHSRSGNHTAAFATFLKACELDYSASCVDAGALVDAGKGTSADSVKARELYALACREEVGAGCFALAALLARGRGGERNWGEAVELHEKACALGHKQGCRAATRLAHNPPDWRCMSEAECESLCGERLGKACMKLGDLRADKETAELLATQAGNPEPPDGWTNPACVGAYSAYDLGCEHGDGVSCFRVREYAKACAAGVTDGCIKAAFGRYQDGDAGERKQIIRALDMQCRKQTRSAACIQLAALVEPADPVRAQRLLTRGCDKGNAIACRILGNQFGVGDFEGGTTPCAANESLASCEQSIKEAQKQLAAADRAAQKGTSLLLRACVLGDRQACDSARYFSPADVAKKMLERGRKLLENQSCGRGGIDF